MNRSKNNKQTKGRLWNLSVVMRKSRILGIDTDDASSELPTPSRTYGHLFTLVYLVSGVPTKHLVFHVVSTSYNNNNDQLFCLWRLSEVQDEGEPTDRTKKRSVLVTEAITLRESSDVIRQKRSYEIRLMVNIEYTVRGSDLSFQEILSLPYVIRTPGKSLARIHETCNYNQLKDGRREGFRL